METSRMGTCQTIEEPRNLPSNKLLVLLDTNFLIYMAQGLIAPSQILETLDYAYCLLTIAPVKKELETLSKSNKPKLARLAARALELLSQLKITLLDLQLSPEIKADDAIILAAQHLKKLGFNTLIATCDKSMRRRARALGIPTLYYRESEGILETDWVPI